MKVSDLSATAVQDGRIAVTWRTPADPAFRGTRVLRRERRFPTLADLGSPFEVYHDTTKDGEPAQFVDGPLQGERVYYYTLVGYDAAGRMTPATISALSVAPYRTDDRLYSSLPEIYQLFDRAQTVSAAGVPVDARARGALRRLMEIVGQPFDLVRSYAASMRDLHDLERTDGGLLPLLAQWVGLPPDITLDFEQQRNDIRYSPAYSRTAGVPANLRAAINRYVNWDARIKELVHNVMQVSHPEQLTIWSMRRQGTVWQSPVSVNLDIAFEGRVSAFTDSARRAWLVYHARQSAPAGDPKATGPSHDRWHLFAKIDDAGEEYSAIRLTSGAAFCKHPTAVQRLDGSTWMFYASYAETGGQLIPHIGLQVLAVGRAARRGEMVGTTAGPFALTDGDALAVTIHRPNRPVIERTVVVRAEHAPTLGSMSAADLARLLDDELPEAEASATPDGRIRLRAHLADAQAGIQVRASALVGTLGLVVDTRLGTAAVPATLQGSRAEPFVLVDQATLTLRIDHDPPRTVVFEKTAFANIGAATAAEVVAAIEQRVPGVASVVAGGVLLTSRLAGDGSIVAVLIDWSTAAPTLGLGTGVPVADVNAHDDEPAACVDAAGNVWLFWASRQDGTWKVWYSRFDGTAWGAPQRLTKSALPEREPFALFDPASGGRLWTFWTAKNGVGRRNVVSRTTTNLDFTTLADGDWTERENGPQLSTADNREPAAALGAGGGVELFVVSNRADGWNIWTRTVTPAAEGVETAVTAAQVSRRGPMPLPMPDGSLRLYLRSNDSQSYSSRVYPSAITLDARYSGSTAVDFSNPTKLSQRGTFADIQRYTYDTRRPKPTDERKVRKQDNEPGMFARDQVGVYLTPDTDDQELILRQRRLFANAIRRVLPIQVQIQFLVDRSHTEIVYTYGRPDLQPPLTIAEGVIDTVLSEVIRAGTDSHRDRATDVRFLRTWVPGETTTIPDLTTAPFDLSTRFFTTRYDEGA